MSAPTSDTASAGGTADLSIGIPDIDAGDVSSTGGNPDSSTNSSETTGTSTEVHETGTDGGLHCAPVAEVEVNCADHSDDDCDGQFDCEDADCDEALECQRSCVPSGSVEMRCDNTKDDDCDGFLDCDDVDCAPARACKPDCTPVPESCSDRADNDCDGFTDCSDADCAATAACCVRSGAEVCSDGVDNDCDGVVDCPVIIGAVPTLPATDRLTWEGGAVSTDKAQLTLATPVAQRYIVQCRSGKPQSVQSKQFSVCDPLDPTALTLRPLGEADPRNPVFNGLVTTQVRFAYPNGQTSAPASHTYYVHNSLANVPECEEKASDADYFGAASQYLLSNTDPTFQDDDARLAAPFVNIAFTPAPSAVFQVDEGAGGVEYLSLRRRFVLNPEKNLVLMKRVYAARRTTEGGCLAATIRKHAADDPLQSFLDNTRYFRTACDAVVLNRQGAGVCLTVVRGTVNVANPNSQTWNFWNFEVFGWVDWGYADNFMWRKLLRNRTGGGLQVFSPKCYEGGASCANGDPNVLFLPDRALFDLE